MIRKIDRWIGRHMSARRWAVLWNIVGLALLAAIVVEGSAQVRLIFIVFALMAYRMAYVNWRRG